MLDPEALHEQLTARVGAGMNASQLLGAYRETDRRIVEAHLDLGRGNLGRRDLEQVPGENNQVGPLAGFDRAHLVRQALCERRVDRELGDVALDARVVMAFGVAEQPAALYVFDLLRFGDLDVRDRPLAERRAALEQLLAARREHERAEKRWISLRHWDLRDTGQITRTRLMPASRASSSATPRHTRAAVRLRQCPRCASSS